MNTSIPSSTEAERAVLGSILIDPRCIYQVMQIIQPSDFYLQKHRWIYEAALSLSNNRNPIDFITVTGELEKSGHIEAVGGASFMSSLFSAVPSALNVAAYARDIANSATRRRLLDAVTDIAKSAYDDGMSVDDILDAAETRIFKARGRLGLRSLLTANEVAMAVMDELEIAREKGEPLEFSTGYTDLDRVFRLRKGEFSILAARPGIGKTALLMNIAQRAAYACKNVLFFSLEMTASALVHRLVVSEGKVKLNELSSGVFPDEQWENVIDGLAMVGGLPLWIDDTPSNYISSMRAQAMRLAAEHPLDVICVDYIQLVKTSERTEKRYQEIGAITRALKAISKDLRCHVLAASQLNRDAEGQVPTLAHLRESGDQEQDADNVLFIERQREVTTNAPAKIIIAKQRQGATGEVSVVWIPDRVSFVPMARKQL